MSTRNLQAYVDNSPEKSFLAPSLKKKVDVTHEDRIKSCTGGICCLFVVIVVLSSYSKWAFGTN
jgi:hypothetical protein